MELICTKIVISKSYELYIYEAKRAGLGPKGIKVQGPGNRR